MVSDLRALGRYRWSGHAAPVGRRTAPWQNTRAVLARFAGGRGRARDRCRAFVAEGVRSGSGRTSKAEAWSAAAAGGRGCGNSAAAVRRTGGDEQILGQTALVEQIRAEAEAAPAA